MNLKYDSYSVRTIWLSLLLSAVVAGCGDLFGGHGGDGSNWSSGKAGAGTGVGGAGRGPAPVDLLSISTNNFVVLSQAGITNTGSHSTAITGNIAASPITAAAMDNVFCTEITGFIFGVDLAYTGSSDVSCFDSNPPTTANTAVADMGTAYADATGRPADFTELGAGIIGGLNLGPATYKWTTAIQIPSTLTLTGGANDVWIFQGTGTLSISSGVQITLAGGALPQNIYWVVSSAADLATTSNFKGTILSGTGIDMKTGATINGRLLAKTAVTLDHNTIGP